MAADGALAKQQLAETSVVLRSRKEPAVALRRVLRGAKPSARRDRDEADVFVFRISGGEARSLGLCRIKSGVGHAERVEEALLEKGIEREAAHDLDDPAGEVDAGLAVFPLGAGLELHLGREPDRHEVGQSARRLRGRAGRLPKAGRVGENLDDSKIGRLARGAL